MPVEVGGWVVSRLSEAQLSGLAILLLGPLLLLAWLIRSRVKLLRSLFLPASIIAGFLVLVLGPQVLGTLTSSGGLFPLKVLSVWRDIPGLMINVVFGAIVLGKNLPPLPKLWQAAAPHALMGGFLSFGQFALGGLAVLFILEPFFGLPREAGALLEISFAGGHGTIAGLSDMLNDAGVGELVDIGLGLATISMITGIAGGVALIRWAVRNPAIPLVRDKPVASNENAGLDSLWISTAETASSERQGTPGAVIAFAAISLAIVLAVVILWGLRLAGGAAGVTVFDKMPLFPVAMVGGFIVQLLARQFGVAHYIDRRDVEGISSIALDILLICAIGTMSLATIGSNIPAVLTFTLCGVAWSVVTLLLWGKHFHRNNWFEHSLADFGQSQGNVATGFALADMVDPERRTSTVNDYGFKQLPYEPFLGGGLLTAIAVPIIIQADLVPFTIISLVMTVLIGLWGMKRNPVKS